MKGKKMIVQLTLKTVWTQAMATVKSFKASVPVLFCVIQRAIFSVNSMKGVCTNVTQSTPKTLNKMCARLARIAARDAPMQASAAVMVVPMLEPSTMATDVG